MKFSPALCEYSLPKSKKKCSTVLNHNSLSHVRCWEIVLLERESVNGKLQRRFCFWKAQVSYLL